MMSTCDTKSIFFAEKGYYFLALSVVCDNVRQKFEIFLSYAI